MNLIQPGTDVPGYRLFRPCRDCFVPVSKPFEPLNRFQKRALLRVERSPQGL